MTIDDVESIGIEKVAEMALEVAWSGAKAVYLSFDIDSVDAGFVPGTGWPEPGGFLPREALKLPRLILAAMEVVEGSPPYDKSDQTARLACRAVLDVLATLVDAGHLGTLGPVAGLSRTSTVPDGRRRRLRPSVPE